MHKTPEQRAWQCGRTTGLEAGRIALAGGGIGLANTATALNVPATLRAAFMNGYGNGITEAAGPIPGHSLTSEWDGTRMRTGLMART